MATWPSPFAFMDRASGSSLATILSSGLGGLFLGAFFGITNLVTTLFRAFVDPLVAFINATVLNIDAIFGGPARFLAASFQSAIASIQPGGMFYVGPFTPILVLLIILAMFYIVTQYLQEESTSDLLPGFVTDLPLLGSEEGR